MRSVPFAIAIIGSVALLGCGDGGTSPSGNGNPTAARFDQIADSIAGIGDYAHADALRHAAEIVRLTGAPTPVTLVIDGQSRPFVAVAEELEYPNFVCSWPGDSGIVFPDSGRSSPPSPGNCEPQGSTRMRTLIAWEPQHMAEVVRLVADEGAGHVTAGVPDAMAGPSYAGQDWGGGSPSSQPTTPSQPGDSVVHSPPIYPGPGFMGEYLKRGEGFWLSMTGTQSNALEQEGGACQAAQAEFDWARYSCQSIRVRFEFSMHLQKMVPIPFDGSAPPDSLSRPPGEALEIEMGATSIAGARLTLLEWLPPPLPPGPVGPPMPVPMPMPSDSGSAAPGVPRGY